MMFQSPSLRGSGRFNIRTSFENRIKACFNPLHCGAVVASTNLVGVSPPRECVSIPFIAGQWSLPATVTVDATEPIPFQSPSLRGSGRFRYGGREAIRNAMFQSPSLRGSGRFWTQDSVLQPPPVRFNPLHCGAVVASAGGSSWLTRSGFVSIPFIAGQWSLRSPPATKRRGGTPFQSPSLRGSGRFVWQGGGASGVAPPFQSPSLRGSGRFSQARREAAARAGFNPLHCGAVVASSLQAVRLSLAWGSFNPLHCGAVVASVCLDEADKAPPRVSIPFIAGQWSLRIHVQEDQDRDQVFQSPSLRGSGRFTPRGARLASDRTCFNPLHCGAVVASRTGPAGREVVPRVSIPFIAGQWSLLQSCPPRRGTTSVSIPFIAGQWSLPVRRPGSDPQRNVSIPFIAGQWSLPKAEARARRDAERVSIPFIAGQWSLLDAAIAAFHVVYVSIPFIAGQWSLPLVEHGDERDVKLVSIPFIAGQWSLLVVAAVALVVAAAFQSPSLRGSGRFTRTEIARSISESVSIPFIAGQWSLRAPVPPPLPPCAGFNPLHCGAVVASFGGGAPHHDASRVSIPFIAGQWSLPSSNSSVHARRRVSIPFIAGQWSLRGA